MDNDYEDECFEDDLDELELGEDFSDENESLSDDEIELAGSLDGEFDSKYDTPLYGGYGASIDIDDLTDEQKDLYDNAYHAGRDANKNEP